MSFLNELYHWVTPTVLVGGILTYSIGIRQKRFDLNQEKYRKIRLTVSDLLSIWNEFAKTERFLKSKDPTNSAIYYVPELAEQFFNLDQRKLQKMNSSFLQSLENLKEIDVILFHKLRDAQEDFIRTNRELFIPLLQSGLIQGDSENEALISILDELMETIEQTILDAIKHLQRRERVKVKRVLDEHLSQVKDQIEIEEPISEVPEFLVKLFNNKVKPKTPFTQADFQEFYADKTVQWIMSKVLTISSLRKSLFSKSGGVKLVFAMLAGNQDYLQKAFENVDENEFQFSKEEALIFVNNKPFYRLIMGFVEKVDGDVPMKIKRDLVKLNTGQVSLHAGSNNTSGIVEKS